MISHKHRCIFVEVPKTGSSSIRSIFGYPPKPHLNIVQIKNKLENDWTHYGGFQNKLISSIYLLIPDKYRKHWGRKQFNIYFKFGFVRNPWDRVVSLYHRREGLQLKYKMSFDDFVHWIKYSSSTCIHPVPQTNQLDWFVDPHGNLLVDYIGKFENLEDDWKYISRKLGINMELPHVNKNPRKNRHYTEFYSEETRDIIRRKFSIDIEYFDYRFGKG